MGRITWNGIDPDFQTEAPGKIEGVFFAYDPNDEVNTWRTSTFTGNPLQSGIYPDGDESSAGCWNAPEFDELYIRFDLFSCDWTAVQAESLVQTPSITILQETLTNFRLNTLSSIMYDCCPTVNATLTFKWEKSYLETTGSPTTASPNTPSSITESTGSPATASAPSPITESTGSPATASAPSPSTVSTAYPTFPTLGGLARGGDDYSDPGLLNTKERGGGDDVAVYFVCGALLFLGGALCGALSMWSFTKRARGKSQKNEIALNELSVTTEAEEKN